MIDVKKPIRKAFVSLLSGNLTYLSAPVPVTDDLKSLADASPVYVLLTNQSGTPASSFSTFDSKETIVLDIAFKATTRANKEVVDGIAAQILAVILPAPGQKNALSPDSGIDISCLQLSGDNYMPVLMNNSNTVIRRLLTFSMHVRQTGN